MNIRFYRVEGAGSDRQEALMDTRGLAALGIPDVQCHFYDLDPGESYYAGRQGYEEAEH
ncbi:DUF4261 domain-containing protein [Brevibacillus invocatus]|uniref:DUF4261 domain-containing protein n=1 Tax=Brevibacillus invocatus TaxID=173959 RepID=UPI001FEBF5C3|nr:DUF4261 domain-containing protein [Brevibacillus invocatus]MCM3080937.1 DUF4261 domain-containing protein [Brevibacillus invocatus]